MIEIKKIRGIQRFVDASTSTTSTTALASFLLKSTRETHYIVDSAALTLVDIVKSLPLAVVQHYGDHI